MTTAGLAEVLRHVVEATERYGYMLPSGFRVHRTRLLEDVQGFYRVDDITARHAGAHVFSGIGHLPVVVPNGAIPDLQPCGCDAGCGCVVMVDYNEVTVCPGCAETCPHEEGWMLR